MRLMILDPSIQHHALDQTKQIVPGPRGPFAEIHLISRPANGPFKDRFQPSTKSSTRLMAPVLTTLLSVRVFIMRHPLKSGFVASLNHALQEGLDAFHIGLVDQRSDEGSSSRSRQFSRRFTQPFLVAELLYRLALLSPVVLMSSLIDAASNSLPEHRDSSAQHALAIVFFGSSHSRQCTTIILVLQACSSWADWFQPRQGLETGPGYE